MKLKELEAKANSDNGIAYMAAFFLLLVIAFFLAWMYTQPPTDPAMNVSFAKVGPISMQAKEFTMRTSLALQSAPEDVPELEKNKKAIFSFVQMTLEKTDPATLGTPDVQKFPYLERQLLDAVNLQFPKAKIQQVWITDFVTSPE